MVIGQSIDAVVFTTPMQIILALAMLDVLAFVRHKPSSFHHVSPRGFAHWRDLRWRGLRDPLAE
jgi:hypothetical protein